jgi:zinc protease
MYDGISRRNDDASQIAAREAAKLVYGANSPYARTPSIVRLRPSRARIWSSFTASTYIRITSFSAWLATSIRRRWRPSCAKPLALGLRDQAPNDGDPAKPEPAKPGYYLVEKNDINQSRFNW